MDDFYIGYLPKAPDNLKGWLLKTVLGIFLFGLTVLMIFLFNYEKSSNSTFEYGIYKELTGRIYKGPIPVIKVSTQNSSKNIVLVNYGKKGVLGILNQLEESLMGGLENYEITLKGSLIYYDGITVFELSESDKSVIDIKPATANSIRSREDLGKLTLTGELVDSKCFFGVMKPAFGKIHRSCAIRCIAGGIPIAVSDNEGGYYFVAGNEIMKYIDLIGKDVKIEAQAYRLDNIKYLNIQDIALAESSLQNEAISMRLAAMPLNLDVKIADCQNLQD